MRYSHKHFRPSSFRWEKEEHFITPLGEVLGLMESVVGGTRKVPMALSSGSLYIKNFFFFFCRA